MAERGLASALSFAYPALMDSPLVLCVDDDPGILELLEDVLTALGLRAICTSDCELALKLVGTEPVDVAVLDYHMPQMDGLTLAKAIRDKKAELPVILFSGAPLPVGSLALATRIVHKGEGALQLADAILSSLHGTHASTPGS
jgi:CheY-like chemotaxis protein